MTEPIIERLQAMGKPEKEPEFTHMPILIGIGHRARHGKDTVAAIIKQHRGNQYNIIVSPFAAALKREVNKCAENSGGMINLFSEGLRIGGYLQENGNILPLPEWVQYDPNAPMDDPLCPYGKQRHLLQWWGGEYRRSVNPNYWVTRNAEAISKSGAEIVLVPDLRYPNEFEFIRKYGAAVKVHRPGVDIHSIHPSELALAHLKDHEWDAVIYNEGTLEDLEKQALYTFDSIMEERQEASRN